MRPRDCSTTCPTHQGWSRGLKRGGGPGRAWRKKILASHTPRARNGGGKKTRRSLASTASPPSCSAHPSRLFLTRKRAPHALHRTGLSTGPFRQQGEVTRPQWSHGPPAVSARIRGFRARAGPVEGPAPPAPRASDIGRNLLVVARARVWAHTHGFWCKGGRERPQRLRVGRGRKKKKTPQAPFFFIPLTRSRHGRLHLPTPD